MNIHDPIIFISGLIISAALARYALLFARKRRAAHLESALQTLAQAPGQIPTKYYLCKLGPLLRKSRPLSANLGLWIPSPWDTERGGKSDLARHKHRETLRHLEERLAQAEQKSGKNDRNTLHLLLMLGLFEMTFLCFDRAAELFSEAYTRGQANPGLPTSERAVIAAWLVIAKDFARDVAPMEPYENLLWLERTLYGASHDRTLLTREFIKFKAA